VQHPPHDSNIPRYPQHILLQPCNQNRVSCTTELALMQASDNQHNDILAPLVLLTLSRSPPLAPPSQLRPQLKQASPSRHPSHRAQNPRYSLLPNQDNTCHNDLQQLPTNIQVLHTYRAHFNPLTPSVLAISNTITSYPYSTSMPHSATAYIPSS